MSLAESYHSPFSGLRPFTEDHARYFFGRARETRLIASNVLSASHLVVFGPSGVGKSSALWAGVMPRLRASYDATVVMLRDWSDEPEQATLAALRDAAEERLERQEVPPETGIPDAVRTITEAGGGPVVLILDQFEEYFHRVGRDRGAGFEEALGELARVKSLDAHLVFGIRYDELGRLDQLRRVIPDIMLATFELTHLDTEQAADAIREPVRTFNDEHGTRVPLDEALLVRLIADCRIERLEPRDAGLADQRSARRAEGVSTSYLQIALERLWAEAQAPDGPMLSLAAYEALGGVEQIAQEHFARVLDRLSRREALAAAQIFQLLVTRSGTKMAMPAVDLAREARLDVSDALALLDKLRAGDARILRVAVPHAVLGRQRYEITHDVLAAPIVRWRTEILAEASRRAEEVVATAMAGLVIWDRYAASELLRLLVTEEAEEQGMSIELLSEGVGVGEERLLLLARRLAGSDGFLRVEEADDGGWRIALADAALLQAAIRWCRAFVAEQWFGCLVDLCSRDVIELWGGGALIGRQSQPNLSDRTISRTHVAVLRADPAPNEEPKGPAQLIELRSVNGTTFNAQPVLYGSQPPFLNTGDLVVLSNVAPLLFVGAQDFMALVALDDLSTDAPPLGVPKIDDLEDIWGVVVDGVRQDFTLLRGGPVQVSTNGALADADDGLLPVDLLLQLTPKESHIGIRFGSLVTEAQLLAPNKSRDSYHVVELPRELEYAIPRIEPSDEFREPAMLISGRFRIDGQFIEVVACRRRPAAEV